MSAAPFINYHFMIDDKFIDDFILDAESICSNNVYLFNFHKPTKHVTSSLGIFLPLDSNEINSFIKRIRAEDRIFVHWYNPKLLNILNKIPNDTMVFLCFWGGDFLDSPAFSRGKHKLNKFLYDTRTLKYVRKTDNQYFVRHLNDRFIDACKTNNLKNIISTLIMNTKHFGMYLFNQTYTNTMINRRDFLLRTSAVCHWNRYDIKLLNELYKVDLSMVYFSYAIGEFDSYQKNTVKSNSTLVFWIGNSDTATNNHIDIFESLRKFREEDIKIICPLNYGNESYSNFISKKGENIFGEKFLAIKEFVSRNEYYSLMDQADIVIMPHNRSQAGANIVAFLKKGKKVFLKSQSTIYKTYSSLGIKVFCIDDLLLSSFDELRTKMEDKDKDDKYIQIGLSASQSTLNICMHKES
jgi:hypothetical protein